MPTSAFLWWRIALWLVASGVFGAPAQSQPLAGDAIPAVAHARYLLPNADSREVHSNVVRAVVSLVEALELSSGQVHYGAPDSQVDIHHVLKNAGNGPSSYRFAVNSDGCALGGPSSAQIRLFLDANGNGQVDAMDREIPLGANAGLVLRPTESASLLLRFQAPLSSGDSAYCVNLALGTLATGQQHSRLHRIHISGAAVLRLSNSVELLEPNLLNGSTLRHHGHAHHMGGYLAKPTPAVPAGDAIWVDGAIQSLLLVRVPLNTAEVLVAGSLHSPDADALLLYRHAQDAPFAYRSTPDTQYGAVVEVAIGLLRGLPKQGVLQWEFETALPDTIPVTLQSQAEAIYDNGLAATSVLSNRATVRFPDALGLSLAASAPYANVDARGEVDHTATVRFSLLVRNYHGAPLYDVRIRNPLEQMRGGLGRYSASALPGPGEYTVVADSLRLISLEGPASAAEVDHSFTGQEGTSDLLASNAVLAPGSALRVQFDVRFHQYGLPATLHNNAVAHALLSAQRPRAYAQSVNGLDLNVRRPGNALALETPTPYANTPPVVRLSSALSTPRLVDGTTNSYDLDFSLEVRNDGTSDVHHVRLVEDLDCAFQIGASDGAVQQWVMQTPPTSMNGLLVPAKSYTGRGTCEVWPPPAMDAVQGVSLDPSLALVDGPTALPVGASDTLRFTVRVTMKSDANTALLAFSHRAWVAVLQRLDQLAPHQLPNRNDGNVAVLWATQAQASVVRVVPTGVVYNAATRSPVAGARVSLLRETCQSSAPQAIVGAEIAGDTSAHIFHPDGSVSAVTDAGGSYHLMLNPQNSPDLCTYRLSVEPPDSALVFPSRLIPAQVGVFSACGAVSGSTGAPQQGEDTRHFYQLDQGAALGSGTVCHAFQNHIPLDPVGTSGLRLQKKVSVHAAEIGELIDYTLTVANDSTQLLPGVTLSDQLPAGFLYVPGSTRRDAVVQPDPAGGAGPRLVFPMPDLGPGATATLSYQARIGIGAVIDQDAVNRAWASAGQGSATVQSNQASARVHVLGGVFSGDAFAFGKVFLDCNRNGLQDPAEDGIPGVRLFMEDGSGVVTDSEGKWSLYGLRPITHVLRLDRSTLPAEAELRLLENRQAGQADSLFLDLQRGEWRKANFAVANCEQPRLLQEVQDRRAALDAQPGLAEDGVLAAVRLALDAAHTNQVSSRSGPAAGVVESQGAKGDVPAPEGALISLQGAQTLFHDATQKSVTPVTRMPGADRTVRQVIIASLAPQEGVQPVDLQALMSTQDSTLAFLNLHDLQVLPGRLFNVRVKGHADAQFALLLNGLAVAQDRVGQRVRMERQGIEAWEYIGVAFQPGLNTLTLHEHDPFGNLRDTQEIRVFAPGALDHIALDVAATAPADAQRPLQVELRLLDAQQVPVMEATMVTLEAMGARWAEADMNPQEPGVQRMVEGANAMLTLIPPSQPGEASLRVSAGERQTETRILFLPDLRPLTGVGILEGVLRLQPGGVVPMGAPRAADAFESDLLAWSHGSAGQSSTSGRSAFYFKGAVHGDYLLTLAYDTDKRTALRMFRDIQPDQYYPIYGDSGVRTFDAQSSQRLYVRVDKNRSYLLYGDHSTASSTEVRKLSQVAHNATGVKHVLHQKGMRISSHVSHEALEQQVEEFPANGTSGPFFLHSPGDLFSNSEMVQVVVRDRSQPNRVLRTTTLTRFTQYTIEPLSGSILLTAPVASLDADLHPQSIRVTYACDEGGPGFWAGGADVQFPLSDRVQIGGVLEYEGAPDKELQLTAATLLARVDAETVLRAEAVQTQSDLQGQGQGVRLQVADSVGGWTYDAQMHATDAGFHNPYAGIAAGQTDLVARTEYALNAHRRVKADVAYTRMEREGGAAVVRTQGAGIALQQVLSPQWTAELGLRTGQGSLGALGGFDYRSVSSVGASAPSVAASALDLPSPGQYRSLRGRLALKPAVVPSMQLFAEVEQDLDNASRQLSSVGGRYAISPRTHAYGRYEVLSSAGRDDAVSLGDARSIGLLGLESTYMEGGRVYDELRMADTLDGRALQSAMGVRNSWPISPGLRLSGGLEQVSAVPGSAGTITGASRAWTTAFDWWGQGAYVRRMRASGSAEWREGWDTDSRLLSSSLAYKWSRDWSVLTRGIVSRVHQHTDNGVHDRRRAQVGLAYRPVGQDVWNALVRYERKLNQRHSASEQALPSIHAVTDILSSHLNFQPAVRDQYSARLAIRHGRDVRHAVTSRHSAALGHGRWTHQLSEVWDMGLQAGLWRDDRGASRHTAGAELGHLLGRGMWLSVGYNVLGLHDPDLCGADYTDTGFYLRLRFKFDERLVFSDADAPEYDKQGN